MRIGYRFSNEGERIHVYSSSAKNTELITFKQELYNTRAPVQLTNIVDYPNIIATNTIHPQTGYPLFYVMKLPLFSYEKESDIQSAVKIKQGDEIIERDMYYITHDDNNILLYTNLQNGNQPYEVIYVPYPNSTISRPSKLLLSTQPALTLNDDYMVSYNGRYLLSKELYVKPNPDVNKMLVHLYEADIDTPWYVFLNPMTTEKQQILPINRTVNVTLPAKKITTNLYKVDANDVESVSCEGTNIISCSSDGFILMESQEYIKEVNVTINTKRNIVTDGYFPFDFRPTINGYNDYRLTIA